MIFIAPLLVFLVAVFGLPMLFVLVTAFVAEGSHVPTLAFFARFFANEIYLRVLANTLSISGIATALTLAAGYPVAYFLSRQAPARRMFLSLLLLLPFYTSVLVKSFAFSVILGHNGVVNGTLRRILGPEFSLALLHNSTGVMIGIVHDMLPFMVFPILVSLLAQDQRLPRAAEIMGAGRMRIFWRITFPLSLPGVFAGVLLVVVRSMGQYAVPSLLGGRQDMMMANLIRFHIEDVLDWNMAAAISVVLMVLSGIFLLLLGRAQAPDAQAARL
jgi:ABC-type spermidine/putrescine transport system permease subunit I